MAYATFGMRRRREVRDRRKQSVHVIRPGHRGPAVVEIRAILTADQQKVFDGNLKEMRDRMEARRNGSS